MATGLTAAWQGMQAVTGDRTMPKLKKAFGQYNAYEDPKFYQDWEMFERNPNPQRAQMIMREYGNDLDIKDQAQLVNMIKPMEGTLQGQEYRNNLLAGDVKGEELETLQERNYGQLSGELKLSNTELGLDKNNLAAEQIDYDSDVLSYKQQEAPYKSSIDAQISSNETNIMQNNMTQQEIEALLDEGVPEQKAATAIAQLEANEVQSIYNKLMNQNKVNDANKLYDYFIRNQKANTETAEFNSTITGNRADISTETKEDEIQMIKDNTVLSRLEKELGLYSQPYRKQNVKYDNNIKGNQSDMSNNELWQSNRQRDFLEGLGDNELMSALGFTGDTGGGNQNALSPERIVGQTADGRNIYSGVNSGSIVYDLQTGQPRAITEQEKQNAYYSNKEEEIMVNPAKLLIESPMTEPFLNEEERNTLRNNYAKNMPMSEARQIIDLYTKDPELSDLIINKTKQDYYGRLGGTSYEEFLNPEQTDNTQPQPSQQELTEDEMLDKWLNNNVAQIDFGGSAKEEADNLMQQAAAAGISKEELINTIKNNFDSMQQETDADLNHVFNILKTQMDIKEGSFW